MGGSNYQLSRDERPHLLAIPYPMIGHLTPIVQICKILIAQAGCRVTLACHDKHLLPHLWKVLPELNYDTIPFTDPNNNITVLPISDGLPEDPDGSSQTWDTFRTAMRAFDEGMPRLFAAHIDRFRGDVACILSDLYLSWTQDVAEELGVPRLAAWISSTAEFQVYFHAKELIKRGTLPFRAPPGRDTDIDNMIEGLSGRPPIFHRRNDVLEGEESISLHGLPALHRRDFPTFLQVEDASDYFFTHFFDNFQSGLQASMFLFNTFHALDATLLDTVRSQGIPAHPVGPLFLLEDLALQKQNDNASKNAVQSNEEYPECLKWLDTQKPNSVIYVAFGTLVYLTMAQVKEMAWGLCNSGQPFIWVYPKRDEEHAKAREKFLQSFLEQVQGKGLVLEWAPQKRILKHLSIGVFLSHCGWNSTLEAISYGVPMLCLPFASDHFLICKLVVDEWRVGLRLARRGKEGIALAKDITDLIQELLVDEKGKHLQKQAEEFKQAAKKSTEHDSSSQATFDAIIKILKSTSTSS